jgi:hypothetical protein
LAKAVFGHFAPVTEVPDMMPTAFLEHQLPGRVRLKISSKRGDVSFFQSIVQRLVDHPDIDELSANPQTGSILILHSGDVDAIAHFAAQRGIFEMRRREPISAPARAKKSTDAAALEVRPLTAAAVGLSGLGLYQITQGQPLGSAVENFWNAFGAYRILKNPALAFGLVGFGLYQLMRGQLLGSASSLFFYALVAHHIASENSHDANAAAGQEASPDLV